MAAHQAPPFLGFSMQEQWSGLPFPSPMRDSEKWKGLSDPVDCSQPGSFVHGIFQARVLEWGAIAFSRYRLTFCKSPPLHGISRSVSLGSRNHHHHDHHHHWQHHHQRGPGRFPGAAGSAAHSEICQPVTWTHRQTRLLQGYLGTWSCVPHTHRGAFPLEWMSNSLFIYSNKIGLYYF